MKNKLFFIFFIFFIQYSLAQDSSDKIRKNINSRNQELENIRKEIINVENKLNTKIEQAISTTEKLINLESKILLTEKLIRSLKKEENYMEQLLQITKLNIDNKENYLSELRTAMSKRAIYLYKFGRPSMKETILNSKNWNQIIYKIKYLKTVADTEKKMINNIEITLNELNIDKLEYQNTLEVKTQLRIEHQKESNNLENDKKKRKRYLKQVEDERYTLE